MSSNSVTVQLTVKTQRWQWYTLVHTHVHILSNILDAHVKNLHLWQHRCKF